MKGLVLALGALAILLLTRRTSASSSTPRKATGPIYDVGNVGVGFYDPATGKWNTRPPGFPTISEGAL